MDQRLRCYAQRYGDAWHVICTDLDIAADGSTLVEAKSALIACVDLYLEGVAGLPADQLRQAMTRRAPWHVRTKMAVLAWLHKSRGRRASSRAFVLDCSAMVPAHA